MLWNKKGRDVSYDCSFTVRLGDEERRVMHLVPAPAARPKKRRVLSRPGLNSPLVSIKSEQKRFRVLGL